MSSRLTEEQMYEIARKRVEEKKGFLAHLAAYILVNIILILIWAFAAGGGFPWFLFPLCGWGIGLVFHFLGVYVLNKDSAWETRQIDKEMERMRRRDSGGN